MAVARFVDHFPDCGIFDEEASAGFGNSHAVIVGDESLLLDGVEQALAFVTIRKLRRQAGGQLRQFLPAVFKTILYDLVSIDKNRIGPGVVGQKAEGRLGVEPRGVCPVGRRSWEKATPCQATEAMIEQSGEIGIAGKIRPGLGELRA